MRLGEQLEQLCRQHTSCGVALAIVREAKIVYAQAFGHYGEQPLTEDSFGHFGVNRGRTFNFVLGYPAEQTGVIILISQTTGLSLCEDIAHMVLGDSRSLPALRWLLPPEHWRADGRRFATQDTDVSGLRNSAAPLRVDNRTMLIK